MSELRRGAAPRFARHACWGAGVASPAAAAAAAASVTSSSLQRSEAPLLAGDQAALLAWDEGVSCGSEGEGKAAAVAALLSGVSGAAAFEAAAVSVDASLVPAL